MLLRYYVVFFLIFPFPLLAQKVQTAEEGKKKSVSSREKKGKVGSLKGGKKEGKKGKSFQEVVVTASRREEKRFDTPATIHIFSAGRLQNQRMIRSLPQAFEEFAPVLTQKTANAQGSPFLRGFTSFRNLFLIDGIRLNNSVFREGPNQYWATVDPFLIKRLEVLLGPGSVLYGSDAIGGVVQVITHRREKFDRELGWNGRVYYRFGSADNSHILRTEVEGNYTKRLGFLGGVTYRTLDDLRGGRHVQLQPKTGYDQLDADAKLEYFLRPELWLTLAYQHTKQEDAWRTHKTQFGISWRGTTVGSELKRELSQQRDLVYLQLQGKKLSSVFHRVKSSLSFHYQQEEQYRIKSSGDPDFQGFQVATLGFFTHIESQTPVGDVIYGLEYYRDFVHSFKKKYNPDGSLKSVELQGPVGDKASYDIFGLFLHYEKELLPDLLAIALGGRYTKVFVEAKEVEDPVSGNKISIDDDFDSVVGSGKVLFYAHPEYLNFYFGVSQGFRAPNLSDLTRLDTARSNEIETPSPNLKPEKYITLEVGSKFRSEFFTFQAAYYYTFIDNMIVRFPTGNTIGGDFEVKKANVGDGFVHGVELHGSYLLPLWKKKWGEWRLFASFAWLEGEVDTYPTSAQIKVREPISRMLPATVILRLRWDSPKKKYWAEGVMKIAGKQDRLSTRDKNDTQRIPPKGTPGYVIFILRGGAQLYKNLNFSASLENITNKDYRVHGSGLNEPGINLLFSLDWRF
ncbi:MAG: TonB-dependent receptor [Planctomycetota bacterium]|nr:MAG: TonB-dependent receptor [Planctomycetota bacterium]